MDALSEFLRAAAMRPFLLGEWDCGAFTAAWVLQVRGVDPGIEWRSRYRTALGLVRLLKRRGGMVAHFDACLAAVGVARTDTPKRGDVAVVETPQGETGAIVLGGTVAMLKGPGIIVRRAPILAAWSV